MSYCRARLGMLIFVHFVIGVVDQLERKFFPAQHSDLAIADEIGWLLADP